MIDTHSHVYGEEFSDDIEQVLTRAREAGVEKIILPNIDMDTIRPMLALCEKNPGYLYPTMGLHPENVGQDWRDTLERMESLLQRPTHPFVAIGEVGLDYYWDKTYYKEQQEAFHTQVQWALRYGLPLVIHCRDAHSELLDAMEPYRHRGLRGVFHCFGGTLEQAQDLLAHDGFLLGIGGILTFKKSPLPQVLAQLPLSRIVVETDSPYLAPTPHRGKRNESAFCAIILQKLAEVYGLSTEEVSRQTTLNARQVFTRICENGA